MRSDTCWHALTGIRLATNTNPTAESVFLHSYVTKKSGFESKDFASQSQYMLGVL